MRRTKPIVAAILVVIALAVPTVAVADFWSCLTGCDQMLSVDMAECSIVSGLLAVACMQQALAAYNGCRTTCFETEGLGSI